jgi:hypothetical protein
MSSTQNQYDIGLDKTPANYVALSPLSFIARSAAVYPDHVSAIYEGRVFTWAETYSRCRRFASYLAKCVIAEGDTVAAMLPNIPAMNELHFAVPMAGAVLNALNIRLDAPSIAFQLDHGAAKIIVVDPEFSGVIAEALTLMNGPKPVVVDVDDASFPGGKRIGEIEYEAALAQGDVAFVARPPQDEWDAIALSYTSGTTGNPKGVVTHHRGAYLNAVSNILAGQLGQHPVYLLTLPMFPLDHCGRGRHQCLPAQGRADEDFRADQEARRQPHVRCADRLQHVDQRTGRTEGQGSKACRRPDCGGRAAGCRARGRREHRHQADPCLRADRSLRAGFGLRRTAGLG